MRVRRLVVGVGGSGGLVVPVVMGLLVVKRDLLKYFFAQFFFFISVKVTSMSFYIEHCLS